MCFVMPHTLIRFRLMILVSLIIILLRCNCHLLTSNDFELLCNVCYWKYSLMIFVVSLHQQALISCGAKCYFSKPGYQLFLVHCFWKKLKTINFHFFFSFLWPKMSHIFKNGSLAVLACPLKMYATGITFLKT